MRWNPSPINPNFAGSKQALPGETGVPLAFTQWLKLFLLSSRDRSPRGNRASGILPFFIMLFNSLLHESPVCVAVNRSQTSTLQRVSAVNYLINSEKLSSKIIKGGKMVDEGRSRNLDSGIGLVIQGRDVRNEQKLETGLAK